MNRKIKKIGKDDFPEKILKIKNVPKSLYLIGNEKLLFEESFAVIGTRHITDYGIKNCEFFTKELVLRGIPVVSGMAIGTDSVAHKTALKYGGKTIAVLGSGFNKIYPKENIGLYLEIIKSGGLVISEYSPDTEKAKEHFPQRNRIVTAISEGILIIEAGYRSGTSITANNAKIQGKKVFAIPGKLDSCVGVGVNNLIKKGAILTTNIDDILSSYPHFGNRMRITTNRKKKRCVKEEYKEIYKIIEKEESFLDDILIKTDLRISDILKIITNMEIEGLIEKNILGKYKIKIEN